MKNIEQTIDKPAHFVGDIQQLNRSRFGEKFEVKSKFNLRLQFVERASGIPKEFLN